MKQIRRSTLILLAVWLTTVPLSAFQILFEDNFDSENGGNYQVNYTGFANWEVSEGTVDLIGQPPYDFLPDNGLYVDMDGSTQDAGKMTTKTAFAFVPGAIYTLQFDLAGAQHEGSPDVPPNSVIVQLGTIFNETITLGRTVPFTTYTHTFSVAAATSGALSFEGVGGDNVGLLLDNVRLSVPAGNGE